MKALPENCPHPKTKRRTTTQGFEACTRCDTDVSNPARARSYQLSARVVVEQGDRVTISNNGHARDHGRFQYAETSPATGLVSIAVLCHEYTSKGDPVGSGWRFVRPDRVRRA